MRKVLTIFGALLWVAGASAQNNSSSYQTALGLKFYPGAGVTFKHFVKENAAIEAIGYLWRDGIRLTGLYEFHGDVNGAPGLKWYVGPGVHVSAWNDRWRSSFPQRRGGSSVGIDGVLGLDYKFKGAPINMSIDWQPSFDLRYSEFAGNWGGLALRYTF